MDSLISSFRSLSLLALPPAPPPPPSPPPTSQIQSDVFLSFRGKDTRDNFTSHLHKALVDKQIVTFIDDKLNRGDEISPSLLKAIEESQIAIIIFSRDYASSRWCLEELVKILECRKKHRQIVIPIFYKIDPSAVRKQTGSFEIAFANHQSLKENSNQVQKWKDALNLAGNISGFDSRVVKPESLLIEEIVKKVLKDLNRQNNVSPSVYKKLVGIESRIEDIELLLGIGDQKHNDVRSVGIWGIGGIGKTTLAKAVCEKISYQFEGFHFVESVREALEKKEPKCLRQELYLAILKDKNVYNYQLIKKRFSHMKLLIILDDVTSIKQVDDLFEDLDCFGLGSRIIITSRDKQVLKNYGVNYMYEVKELSFDNSFKLFCKHAFKQNCPRVGCTELSKGVVRKVGGVPLALKVLGSFLLDKKKKVWESSMKKLENSLDKDIYGVLKISYDGLDPNQQRLFLDIACFCKGWDVNLAIAIMDASGFYTDNELSALEDKSLIFKLDNKLMMHDLLQAMGKTIVQQESIDPGERTRLCNRKDIYDVLTKATGISLDMSNIGDIQLHPDAFVKMPNLRFLRFYASDNWKDNNNKMHVPQNLKFLLTELRYFEWDRCPLQSLQSISHLENLVTLNLRDSNVEQLWNGVQLFDHLKMINLSRSKKLIRLPYFKAPKLGRLLLDECKSLIEMPLSFQHLTRLMTLSLFSCKNLASVPQLPKSLHSLNLNCCSKLRTLPQLPNHLEELRLSRCSSLIAIPSSIRHLARLNCLDLRHCISLTSILDCTGLISLQHFFLSHCLILGRLSEISNNLKRLQWEGSTSLFEIPLTFKGFNKLYILTIMGCESLASIPDLMSLNSLNYLIIESCSKLKVLPEFPNKLVTLTVKRCESLTSIPNLRGLNSLIYLTIESCSKLKVLPEFPNKLQRLTVKGFDSLTSIPDLMGLKSLDSLTIESCSKLKVLPEFPNNLRDLILIKCGIIEIPESIINISNLISLNISHCERLRVLPKLPWAHVDACNCTSLQELSGPSFPNNYFSNSRDPYASATFISRFQLYENSLTNFVKDTELEMMAASLPSFPLDGQVCVRRYPTLGISYPGREIPEQFTFQCSGSFIDVKLPLDWINYNFLCFALCAIVSFSDQSELPYDLQVDSRLAQVTYKCNLKSTEGGHDWDGKPSILGGFYNSADCSMRSSYVIIRFGLHFIGGHDNEITFKFNIVYDQRYKKFCKVEKCGVHLIFGKHLDKLDSEESMEDAEPHLGKFSGEDEPHSKRLKHS